MRLSCYEPSQIIPKSRAVHLADKQILNRHILSYPKIMVSKSALPPPPGRVLIPDPWTIVADPAIVTKARGRVLSLHSLADFFFSFCALAELFCRNTHPPQTLPNPPPPNLRRFSLQPQQVNVLRVTYRRRKSFSVM